MLISKYDKLYDVDNNVLLSPYDLINGKELQTIKSGKFFRHYTNPDMFYLDKSIGLTPSDALIDKSGDVYYDLATA